MEIKAFFESETSTLTYVVYDKNTGDAILIDPVLDYDLASSTIDTHSAKGVIEFIKNNNLNLHYILETHAHADHLSSSHYLKKIFPDAKIGIGANIKTVQTVFKGIFNIKDLNTNGVQFDHLFEDEEVIQVGPLSIKVLYTPGHTPACVSYLINEEIVFTEDALFMEDAGTGRCDFPGGSASTLYQSISTKLFTLSDHIRVYVGHDYQPNGRSLKYETTIGIQKEKNIQLNQETTKETFVSFRNNRDATLKAPRLLLESLQTNINAGKLPEAEDNQTAYFKLPIRWK